MLDKREQPTTITPTRRRTPTPTNNINNEFIKWLSKNNNNDN
jgi:hypothetical protein